MAFKTTLFVCGLVLSIQNAYSQVAGLGYNGLGFNNVLTTPSYGAVGLSDLDFTAIDIDARGIGAAYGYGGLGLGNVGTLGIGAAGIGSGLGLGGVGNLGNLGNFGGVAVAPMAVANPTFLNLGAFSAGGLLPISSLGPIAPAGLTVVSDNLIDGIVTLDGQLPFLSAVAFDGTFPSAGSGLTQCGCGSAGNIGIIAENAGPVANAANWGGLAVGNLGGLAVGNLGGLGLANLGGMGGHRNVLY